MTKLKDCGSPEVNEYIHARELIVNARIEIAEKVFPKVVERFFSIIRTKGDQWVDIYITDLAEELDKLITIEKELAILDDKIFEDMQKLAIEFNNILLVKAEVERVETERIKTEVERAETERMKAEVNDSFTTKNSTTVDINTSINTNNKSDSNCC